MLPILIIINIARWMIKTKEYILCVVTVMAVVHVLQACSGDYLSTKSRLIRVRRKYTFRVIIYINLEYK